METVARTLLRELCFVDERDGDYDQVRTVLAGFGELGVHGPFAALFGTEHSCAAEVASVFAEQFHRLGYLAVDRLLDHAEWSGLLTGLQERFADRDVRRSVVVAESDLGRLIAYARGVGILLDPPPATPEPPPDGPDLADVMGQQYGRLALELAAAGGHHLAMLGSPGAGKTMLAQRLPSILPALDDQEALEVTGIHSLAGVRPPGAGLVRRPPFQAPHHTASMQALVGGGTGMARPGAISLAHRGVLFLDESRTTFSLRLSYCAKGIVTRH